MWTFQGMVSRQIRNRAMREMGLIPSWYVYRLMPGDRLLVRAVRPATAKKPMRFLECEVRVGRCQWHGHYAIVHAKRLDNGRSVRFLLWAAGPPENGLGVIECRLKERIRSQPEPTKDDTEYGRLVAEKRHWKRIGSRRAV